MRPRHRLMLAGLVVVAAIGVVGLIAREFGVWEMVAHGIRSLIALSATHPVEAAALYVAAYALLVACCVPVGPAMSMAGGVLFGGWIGTACATVGIAAGSIGFFLAARTAFGAAMGRGRLAMLDRLRPQLERDGFSALLALRIAPVVPSWLLGLASALAGMRLAPFMIASILGVLPATAVFATTGAGLGAALANGAPPSLGLVLRPEILLPLLALSVLALLPVIVRRWRARG